MICLENKSILFSLNREMLYKINSTIIKRHRAPKSWNAVLTDLKYLKLP